MEMPRDARPGNTAQIQADIVALRMYQLAQ